MNLNLIKPDYSNLRTFVINLDNYRENYDKQLPYLENIGLQIERFSAINAIKDDHLKEQFRPFITEFAIKFTPKSVIGCALSHILCCKHIYNEFIDLDNVCEIKNESRGLINKYFLIMEDDAFPLYSREDFYKLLNKNLWEINLLDKNWDIIQLHSDAFFPTEKTYITHFFTGSTAAYLISYRGLKKMSQEKVKSHLDFETQNFIKFNKYRVKNNLFYTNEKTSLNRVISKDNISFYKLSLYAKTQIIELINKVLISLPLRGEKTYANFLEFKIVKFPYLKKEYTANEVLDYLFGFYLFKKIVKYI
jgi:GR25 family glycosyltransferase involved in LPS biosynthesis